MNGSQGIVRQINTEQTSYGITYAKTIIVEFPKSKAAFADLPPHYFPISPISWTFATKLNGELIRVNRHQLPVQPAFAVTGHSAEGKTLPNVLVNLHEGGFAAYVAASRATSRNGLCITRPVTLEMLNHPVPYDLQVENKRLEIMEHNTLVKYGFKQGEEQPVFDPESETRYGSQYESIHPKFNLEPTRQNKKRKNVNGENPSKSKRKRPNETSVINTPSSAVHQGEKQNAPITTNYDPLPYGCVWSATDWSCAYDAFFMVFFYIHHSSCEFWTNSWSNYSPLAFVLHEYFSHLSSEFTQGLRPHFNQYRDQIRDILSD